MYHPDAHYFYGLVYHNFLVLYSHVQRKQVRTAGLVGTIRVSRPVTVNPAAAPAIETHHCCTAGKYPGDCTLSTDSAGLTPLRVSQSDSAGPTPETGVDPRPARMTGPVKTAAGWHAWRGKGASPPRGGMRRHTPPGGGGRLPRHRAAAGRSPLAMAAAAAAAVAAARRRAARWAACGAENPSRVHWLRGAWVCMCTRGLNAAVTVRPQSQQLATPLREKSPSVSTRRCT